MNEPDEVDYGDSDSDFADLEVEDEADALPEAIQDGQPLCSDREEGEATPLASPRATSASSELEDGEVLMDSEPMQLEEASSALEAVSKRQADFDDSPSDEEGAGRSEKRGRHELSPRVGPTRAGSNQLNARGQSYPMEVERERERREAKPQGYGLLTLSEQGFRHSPLHMQTLSRNGSLSVPPLPGRIIQMDLATFMRQPRPSADVSGGSLQPAYGPPLEIRGASNLMVHNLPTNNPQVKHTVYQLQAEHRQQLRPATRPLPLLQQPGRDTLRAPPHINPPPFNPRPPFSSQPSQGALLPGILGPPPKSGEGAFLPVRKGGPFRQGNGQFPPSSGNSVHLHPSNARPLHLQTGPNGSPWGAFASGSHPPQKGGRMESLRSQLESQGSLLGDPFRVNPPPPPGRHADVRASVSRSSPDWGQSNQGGQEALEKRADQRHSFSPEKKSPAKVQKGVTVGSGEENLEHAKVGMPEGSDGRSPRKSTSPFEGDGNLDRSPRTRETPSGRKPSTPDQKARVGRPEEEKDAGQRKSDDGVSTPPGRAYSPRGVEKGTSIRSSSDPKRSESQESRDWSESSRKRKREVGARELTKEREQREKDMRVRALAIVQAGRHKKRKERDEQRRNGELPQGIEPGTSGHGVRREGRDKTGRSAPRNWRRPSGFDVDDISRGANTERSPEQRGEPPLRNKGLFEQNGSFAGGRHGGKHGRREAKGGTNGNAVPLGSGGWSAGAQSRGSGGGSDSAPLNGRKAIVGFGPGERDLARFSSRESVGDERETLGPPGFSNGVPYMGVDRGVSNRGREGVRSEENDCRQGSGEADVMLRRSGSGGGVSIGARQPSKTLAVNNLPANFKAGQVEDIFKHYGPVQLVRQTGKSSAEVTFRREEQAKAARANVHRMIKLEGREVLVEYKTQVVR